MFSNATLVHLNYFEVHRSDLAQPWAQGHAPRQSVRRYECAVIQAEGGPRPIVSLSHIQRKWKLTTNSQLNIGAQICDCSWCMSHAEEAR